MSDPIRWQELTREQRNQLVAKNVMNVTRVKDRTLLPESKSKIPDYTTNLNEAYLILLTFKNTKVLYQTQKDLAHIHVQIEEVELSFLGGVGEECAEAICIVALRAIGLEVVLPSSIPE